MGASAAEVLRIVIDALYGDYRQSEEQIEADDERYRRFVVKPDIDVFDPWDILLVEGDRARIIWRRVKSNDVHQQELAPGEFDAVLKQFLVTLADQSHRQSTE